MAIAAMALAGEACTDDEPEGPALSAEGTSESGARRLSAFEYDNVVGDLLLDDTRPALALLPEDKRTPFDNDIGSQEVSKVLVESIELLATQAAKRLVADTAKRDQVVGCTPSGSDDVACLESFTRHFGRLALRRPLTDDEVTDYLSLGQTYSSETGDFYDAVEVVVRGLLQETEFVYRIEIGEPVADGIYRLNGFEIATRMSFLIWGTTPDDALLDRVEAGGLDTPEGVRAAAQTLLDDDRARPQIERFHAMWLGFEALPHAPALTSAMRAESRALIERVVFDEQSSWLDLFGSTETYVDDTLAAHYGLTSPGSSPAWVSYGDSGRKGLLSHGAFLSVGSNPTDTSPTRRGKLVRNRLMCQVVPPPPADVVVDDGPDEISECRLDNYRAHGDAGCRGCHQLMDPIGFGLEQYDMAGRYRTHDEGKPECEIDGEGELTGVGTFNGPAELGDKLIEGGHLDACLVQQLYLYAMGHQINEHDTALVDALTAAFREQGHRFDTLILALVGHESFGFRREEVE